jgi:hypothetical protein
MSIERIPNEKSSQEEAHDLCGVPVERIPKSGTRAVGIRIFRPSPPKKAPADKPEGYES